MKFLLRRRLHLGALVIVAVIAAFAAVPAGATTSGTNGQIAFLRQTPAGTGDVFTANSDGQHEQQVPLVYPADAFSTPRWSPDGSELSISHVVRLDALGQCCLAFRPATVKLDGSSFNLLQPPGAPFDMDCPGGWYPNGLRLLCGYGEEPGIFSIRSSDGGDPTRLTTYPFGSNCNACDESGDVSPDGSRFVFLRFRHENGPRALIEQVALFVENIDGSGLRQITPYGFAEPHELASARWSPDGQEVISETTQGSLFTIRPDDPGLSPSMISLQTGTTRYFAFDPAFSPDGTKIVFCMFINGQEDIYTANADGSGVEQVTNTPDFEFAPDWGTHAPVG
jgi:Tol biopolymer transport system component